MSEPHGSAPTGPPPPSLYDCRQCGACCSYAAEWPRFSLETDERLDLIPTGLIDPGHGRMRAVGNRCAALHGTVGRSVACKIYDIRPDVCRDCLPGDDECRLARASFHLTV